MQYGKEAGQASLSRCGVAWCMVPQTRSNTDLDTSSRYTYQSSRGVTHRYGRDTHRHAQNQKPNALLPLMQMPITSLTKARSPRTEIGSQKSTWPCSARPHQASAGVAKKQHMEVVVSARSHLVRAHLRVCSYLGRLPPCPFRKRLDKTAGRAWPSSECPSLGPNKSRPGPPRMSSPLMKPPESLVQTRRLGYRASQLCAVVATRCGRALEGFW